MKVVCEREMVIGEGDVFGLEMNEPGQEKI